MVDAVQTGVCSCPRGYCRGQIVVRVCVWGRPDVLVHRGHPCGEGRVFWFTGVIRGLTVSARREAGEAIVLCVGLKRSCWDSSCGLNHHDSVGSKFGVRTSFVAVLLCGTDRG